MRHAAESRSGRAIVRQAVPLRPCGNCLSCCEAHSWRMRRSPPAEVHPADSAHGPQATWRGPRQGRMANLSRRRQSPPARALLRRRAHMVRTPRVRSLGPSLPCRCASLSMPRRWTPRRAHARRHPARGQMCRNRRASTLPPPLVPSTATGRADTTPPPWRPSPPEPRSSRRVAQPRCDRELQSEVRTHQPGAFSALTAVPGLVVCSIPGAGGAGSNAIVVCADCPWQHAVQFLTLVARKGWRSFLRGRRTSTNLTKEIQECVPPVNASKKGCDLKRSRILTREWTPLHSG